MADADRPMHGVGTPADTIQRIVDVLASDLGRSVALDDNELRLLAHSPHFGSEDRARIESLVQRSVTPERREFARQQGVLTAQGPLRTDAAPELGLDARLVVPVRINHDLVAIIWIIDDGHISERQIALAEDAAQQLSLLLRRMLLERSDIRRQLHSAVLGVLSDSRAEREHGAVALNTLGRLEGFVRYQASVIDHLDADAARTVWIESAVATALRAYAPASYAYAPIDGKTVIVAGFRAVPADDLRVAPLEAISRAVSRGGVEDASRIGIGDLFEHLSDAVLSYEQALVALRVGAASDAIVTVWNADIKETGIAGLLRQDVGEHVLPIQLRDLKESLPADVLEAVDVYLRVAGNVARASEALHLHRTTVYYRLNRFTEASGLDLDDGEVRFLLQLWFAAGRYTRISATTHTAET